MLRSLLFPLGATLALHTLLLVILLADWTPADDRIERKLPQFVNAQLVELEAKSPEPAPRPAPPKPAPKPKPEPAPRPAPPPPDPAIEAQRAAAEREEQARREQQQRAKEQRIEQERLEKQRREQLERARRELSSAVEEEGAAMQARSDAELAGSFVALIADAIERNWSRPPSARNEMEAELVIQLVPTGEVVSVFVDRSSGSAAFDRSAELAVQRAGRFPELQELPPRVFEQYFRRLRLKFKPEDLRR